MLTVPEIENQCYLGAWLAGGDACVTFVIMFRAKVCRLLCGEIQLLLKEELRGSLPWFELIHSRDREGVKACWGLGA